MTLKEFAGCIEGKKSTEMSQKSPRVKETEMKARGGKEKGEICTEREPWKSEEGLLKYSAEP